MTGGGRTGYDDLRRRDLAEALAAMPDFVRRLFWSGPELQRHRRRSLRLLLRVAQEYSSWHRERLRGIDVATATEADLERIPPMTRDDLMEHWDEICIDPGVRLAEVEAHLEGLTRDAYFLDAYHAVASPGTGGRPGVFVYDRDAWIASFAGCARWRLLNRPQSLAGRKPVVALLTSRDARHISHAIHQTFRLGRLHAHGASAPLDEILRDLNRARPHVLNAHPSVLRALVRSAEDGDLDIRPAYVHCTGEPLPAALRDAVRRLWGVRVTEGWSASEALPLGQTCPAGSMHLADDLVVIEPVDASGGRVPPGTRSDRVLLTNLFNTALPLIRYEIPDQVSRAEEPCVCGSAYGVVSIQGRSEERFVYPDGVTVEPAAFDSVLSRERAVLDYQVLQTEHGAEVRVRSERALHLRAVGMRVASALSKRGLDRPSVSVRRVDSLERLPTGRLQRFVPATALQSQGGAS